MLMQELGRMIKEDPNLCAMTMVDKRKYIISKWNASHSEPIDEDAVALFLCDENRGNLTDDQRAFAKECCAEFEFCNQMTVYRLFQCGEMMRQHRPWLAARRSAGHIQETRNAGQSTTVSDLPPLRCSALPVRGGALQVSSCEIVYTVTVRQTKPNDWR